MKNRSNYFVSKYWRRRGRSILSFELLIFHYFNIDVQPQLVNNNFNEENESLVSSKKWKWQQFNKKKNAKILHPPPNTTFKVARPCLRRTIIVPTCADFNLLLQKRFTAKVNNTKRSSTEGFISSIPGDEEIFARTYARVRKRRENELTHAPNSQSQSRMN